MSIILKLMSREMVSAQRFEFGRFKIFSTAYNRFH